MTIRTVTSGEFVAAFDDVATGYADEICATWHDAPKYTMLFCDQDGVLRLVGEALALNYKKNFLTADSALYSNAVPVVAIEHENDVPGAGHEMKKLGYLDVPLGVLITYPKKPTDDAKILKDYVNDLAPPASLGNLARGRQLLVIFGTMVGAAVSWRYFKFTEAGFERIEPPR